VIGVRTLMKQRSLSKWPTHIHMSVKNLIAAARLSLSLLSQNLLRTTRSMLTGLFGDFPSFFRTNKMYMSRILPKAVSAKLSPTRPLHAVQAELRSNSHARVGREFGVPVLPISPDHSSPHHPSANDAHWHWHSFLLFISTVLIARFRCISCPLRSMESEDLRKTLTHPA
jgi:hypothetical protein